MKGEYVLVIVVVLVLAVIIVLQAGLVPLPASIIPEDDLLPDTETPTTEQADLREIAAPWIAAKVLGFADQVWSIVSASPL